MKKLYWLVLLLLLPIGCRETIVSSHDPAPKWFDCNLPVVANCAWPNPQTKFCMDKGYVYCDSFNIERNRIVRVHCTCEEPVK
jgi:hypothetical protein